MCSLCGICMLFIKQVKDCSIAQNQILVEKTNGTNEKGSEEYGWINSYAELLRDQTGRGTDEALGSRYLRSSNFHETRTIQVKSTVLAREVARWP
uniref:Uncharacterized protein n=1 Tax=Oryza glumipatula TaxID=40148 RepID=A0A0D9YRT3_9ORYZ